MNATGQQTESDRRRALVVLGMHRSGTSALTRVLSLAGATLPRRAMGATEMNVRGFFESIPIFELHEDLLEAFGTSWSDLSPMPEGWHESGVAAQFADRMADIVREEYGGSPLFVLKDPRICRLVPFWQGVFERLDVDPAFILPVRNPLEVSASLASAQQIDEQVGRLLWLQHFVLAERDTRGTNRVIVTYSQLLHDWRRVLARVGDELGLKFPRLSYRAGAEIDGFLTEALRHHEVPNKDIEVRADVSRWVKKAYQWAERAAEGKPVSPQTLDRVANAFLEADEVFGPVVASSEYRCREARDEAMRLQTEFERQAEETRVVEIPASAAGIDARMDDLLGTVKMLLLWLAGTGSGRRLDSEQFEQMIGELQHGRIQEESGFEWAKLVAQSSEPDELETSKNRARELETDLTLCGSELRAVSERLAASQEERDELARRLSAQEEDLEALRLLQPEIEALRQQVEASGIERESLARELEEQDQELRQVVSRRADESRHAAVEIAVLRQRADRLEETEARLASRESEMIQLREQVREHAALQAVLGERDAELDRLRSGFLDMQSELRRLEGLRADQAGERATLELRLAERDGELERVRAASERALEDLRRGREADANRHAEREAALDSELSALRDEALRARELEGQLADAARGRDRLVAEVQRIPQLRELLIASESALTRLDEEFDRQLEARTNELRAVVEELHGERAVLRREAGRAATLREQLLEAETALDQSEEQLAKAQVEIEAARCRQGDLEDSAGKGQEVVTLESLLDSLVREPESKRSVPQSSDVQVTVRSQPAIVALPKRVAKLVYWAMTFQLPRRLRERRAVRRIRASGLFDEDYYRWTSSDLSTDSTDLVYHYVRHGAAEGRNPSLVFDTDYYLDSNPDVVRLNMNPLDHFVTHGWKEGRDPHPLFELREYLKRNPDVAASGQNPLQHWLEYGRFEGRSIGTRPLGSDSWSGGGLARRELSSRLEWVAPSRPRLPAGNRSGASKGTPDSHRDSFVIEFGVQRLDVAIHRRTEEDDPTVIVVTHVLPHPPRAGNEYRISRYVRWLERRGYRPVILFSPLPTEEPTLEQIREAASEFGNLLICYRDGRLLVSLDDSLWKAIELLDGKLVEPIGGLLGRFEGETEEEFRNRVELENAFCPDIVGRVALHLDSVLPAPLVVLTNYVFMTRFVPELSPDTLTVIDTHDMFSSKTKKVAAFGIQGQLQLSEVQERKLLMRGDVTMAIQPDEAREFERIAPERPVIMAGVDFDCQTADVNPQDRGDEPPVLAAIGSDNAMNMKGLRDFIRHAWPRIRKTHPGVRLRVAGDVGAGVPDGTAGVEVLGRIASLDEFYASADLVINPTAAGTGLKIKTLEALAHFRPIVSWPLGADGIPVPLRRYCGIAHDWFEFSEAVSKALANRRTDLSGEDRARVAEILSPDEVYRELGDAIDRHCQRASLPIREKS